MNATYHYIEPDSLSGSCSWRQLCLQAMALLVVFSLGLSFLGPLIDHHFAERLPGHHHIYLGTFASEHDHDFEQFHMHASSRLLTLLIEGADQPGPDDVVVLSLSEGATRSAADLTMPLAQPAAIFGSDRTPLLRTTGSYIAVPSGETIAPQRPPPRA